MRWLPVGGFSGLVVSWIIRQRFQDWLPSGCWSLGRRMGNMLLCLCPVLTATPPCAYQVLCQWHQIMVTSVWLRSSLPRTLVVGLTPVGKVPGDNCVHQSSSLTVRWQVDTVELRSQQALGSFAYYLGPRRKPLKLRSEKLLSPRSLTWRFDRNDFWLLTALFEVLCRFHY